MEKVAENLGRYVDSGIPIGINVGKNSDVSAYDAPEAYAAVIRRMYYFGAYFVINVSSPNTEGLRALQAKSHLTRIVCAVLAAMYEMDGRKPLFVKVSPELTSKDLDDVIEVTLEYTLAGIVATNTTNNPKIRAKYGERWRFKEGGLSGDDVGFRQMSTNTIRYIHKAAGKELIIIGAGGIKDVETALEKIVAGTSLVQLVTALRGEGLGVARTINKGLVDFMEKEGISSTTELVGVAL